MSSNLALVRAFRGHNNQAAPDDEAALEATNALLERLRLKKDVPKTEGVRKILTLPPSVKDWYAPWDVENPQWQLTTDADEAALHQYVHELHKLDIPTFLREATPPSLMRLFIPLDAFVIDSFVQADRARTAWASLHDGLTRLVVSSMAEVALQLFGEKEKASSQLVAVFRASGYSVADGRWKLSLRINFVEIIVTLDTARRVRDLLVERLARACQHRGAWTQALEALEVPQAASALPGDPAGTSQSFWERVVDDRAFQEGAQHRLVWCDVAKGDEQPPLPQTRPLVPHALLRVVAEGGLVDQREVVVTEDLIANGYWVRLGSPWTDSISATEFWGEQSARPQPSPAAAGYPQPSAGAQGPAPAQVPTPAHGAAPAQGPAQAQGPAGGEMLPGGWYKYHATDGRPYYHRPETNETVWKLPEAAEAPCWKQYISSEGKAFYHNTVTGETSWHLPEGAVLIDASAPRG